MSDYNEHIPDGAGDNGDADELVYQSEGCGKAAHCPLKRLGKGDTAVNIIGVAVSAVIVAASIYAQYALTKWAVKSAHMETRPPDLSGYTTPPTCR